MSTIEEEGVIISSYGKKISKELKVFYNPVMKLNRDISLLFIKTYFDKPILFCDPMIASGIREVRFLKTIPKCFDKLTLGDISQKAIDDTKKNFKENLISTKNIDFVTNNALTTLASRYYHYVELDPFGTPVPYIDIALQRVKHKGILSVTATDTAALCGTYPKKAKRRYGVDVKLTHFYEELGLRNLISFVIKAAAKFDKKVNVELSYTKDHYYKVFFQVLDSAQGALEDLENLHYFKIGKYQQIELSKFKTDKEFLGPTYIGNLCNKKIISKMLEHIELIHDKKKIEKLLTLLHEEVELFSYVHIHKLEKELGIHKDLKFKYLILELQERGYESSKTHNSRFGIKTKAPIEEVIKILKT